MSFFKKLLPIVGTAVGSAFGMPQVGAALGSAVAGGLGAGAHKTAATDSVNAFNTSDAAAGTARDASVAGFQPFMSGGTTAFNNALNMQTPGYQYTPSDPSYAFRVGEGENALMRQAAATGGAQSGGTLKALTRYGQQMGSTEFANDFGRDTTLANFGLQGAQGNAAAQSGYATLLQRSALARNGIYNDRAGAQADQYGAGADIGNALFGSGGLFGGKSQGSTGGFDFSGGVSPTFSGF